MHFIKLALVRSCATVPNFFRVAEWNDYTQPFPSFRIHPRPIYQITQMQSTWNLLFPLKNAHHLPNRLDRTLCGWLRWVAVFREGEAKYVDVTQPSLQEDQISSSKWHSSAALETPRLSACLTECWDKILWNTTKRICMRFTISLFHVWVLSMND